MLIIAQVLVKYRENPTMLFDLCQNFGVAKGKRFFEVT